MPITFNTDLKDLEKFDYVEQIPIEALFKNLGYKQARYDQASREIKAQLDPLWNIPAIGPDVARKAEIIKKFNDHLRSYANKDLGNDQGARSALEADIAQMSNDYELSQINQRGTYAKQMDAKRRELTKDGSFLAPYNDEAGQEVRSYTTYDPRVTFRGNIYKNYDFNTLDKKVLDETPEFEQLKIAGNQNETFKGKAFGSIYQNYVNKYQSDPAAMREKWAQFRASHPQQDWSTENQIAAKHAQEAAQKNFNTFASLKESTTDPERKTYYQTKMDEAQSHYQHFGAIHKLKPEMAEQYAFQDWLNQEASDFAEANTNYVLNKKVTNDIAMAGINAALDKEKSLYNAAAQQSAQTGGLNVDEKGNVTMDAGNIAPDPTKTTGAGKVNPQIAMTELGEIATTPESFGKKASTGNYILTEIPGVFKTAVFDRGTQTKKESHTDEDTGDITTTTTKIPSYPSQVTFDPVTKKYRLFYSAQGSSPAYVETLSEEDIRTKIGIAKPSIAKNVLGGNTNQPAAADSSSANPFLSKPK